MMDRIKTTKEFFLKKLNESNYLSVRPYDKRYRIEHTLRVANIAKTIAENEGFDVDGLVVAALLHDVSYCLTFPKGLDDVINHGRFSAQLARPLVESLEFDKKLCDDILYGIAIHVDGKADFPGEESPFALSVSDADNIDRFGAYRLHRDLVFKDFINKPMSEQLEICRDKVEKLQKYEKMRFVTDTATKMWNANIKLSRQYFERLLYQLEHSSDII